MRSLNKLKNKLKNELIEDKFEISKTLIDNLKNEIFQVFKKYTKSEKFDINLSIKVLKSNQYCISVAVKINDLI